jgi:hypothetical protein
MEAVVAQELGEAGVAGVATSGDAENFSFELFDRLDVGLREQGGAERVHRHAKTRDRNALKRRRGHAGIRADQKLHALADQRRDGAGAAADEDRLHFQAVFLPDFLVRRHPRRRRAGRHRGVGDAKLFHGAGGGGGEQEDGDDQRKRWTHRLLVRLY